jgi:hypothetical protein
MRKLTALLATAVLAFAPSCSTVQSARDKLNSMSETDFTSLTLKVQEAGAKAGQKLHAIANPTVLNVVQLTTVDLINALALDTLNVDDVVNGILDRFGSDLAQHGIEQKYLDYVREGAKVIDAAVGQIRLGIDGKLSPREKSLILDFLMGFISQL